MNKGYKLSVLAEQQLEEILEFTEDRFGPDQTDAYALGLQKTFELLAEFPGIGSVKHASEIKRTWLRFRFQSHHIFYAQNEDGTGVLIEALVHASRDLCSNVFQH